MARTKQFIPAPVQGQSEAPDFAMLDDNARRIVNFIPEIPEGLRRRAPVRLLGRVATPAPGVDQTMGKIRAKVDDQRWNLLFFKNPNTGVVTATSHTRNGPFQTAPVAITATAQTYLDQSVVPREDIEGRTIADTTFVLNRRVIVQNSVDTAPARPFEGLLWVKAGFAARNYRVIIKFKDNSATIDANLRTVNGGGPDQQIFLDTAQILTALLLGNPGTGLGQTSFTGDPLEATLLSEGFSLDRVPDAGALLYLTHPTKDFTISIEDGNGSEGMEAIKDEVDSFNNLPLRGFPGFKVKVIASSTSDDDDYWAEYVETAGDATGRWKETLAPGAQLGLDADTMPMAATFSGGTWTIDVLPWGQRTVADETLALDPDFIGETLQDISFFRGRLALIYDEDCALSSASDALAFYPATVVTQADDDPIFLTSTLEEKTKFLWMVNFNRRLLIAGEDAIFEVVSTDGPLRAASATLQNVNGYDVTPRMRPFAVNDRMYFSADTDVNEETGEADTAVVFELAINQATQNDAAEALNTATPNILKGAEVEAAVYGQDFVSVYGIIGTNQLICHVFRYAERQRIQNAFCEWELPESYTIAGVSQDGSRFFIHFTDDTGSMFVGVIEMARLSTGFGSFIQLHLDGQIKHDDPQLIVSYDGVTNLTTILLPYSVNATDTELLEVVSIGAPADTPFDIAEGSFADVVNRTANTIQIENDWTAAPFVVGVMGPRASWFPPEPTARDRLGAPDYSNDYVVTEASVVMRRSGHAELRIDGESLGEFAGLRLNSPDSLYDSPNVLTTDFSVLVGEDSRELRLEVTTQFHLPLNINGLHWYGLMQSRGRTG